MKLRYLPSILLFLPIAMVSQNLVPNYSFEEKTNCPYGNGQYDYVKDWYYLDHYGTPDFFDSCSADPSATVPLNNLGDEVPSNGSAYVGISLYRKAYKDYREYIAVELKSPMTQGKHYTVAFRSSVAEYSDFFVHNLGVLLSDTVYAHKIKTATVLETPQLTVNYRVDTYIGWKQHYWDYVAQGGEKFMIIGNFDEDSKTTRDSAHIPFSFNGLGYAYIFIDEVIVDANYVASVANPKVKKKVRPFPNPVQNSLTVQNLEEDAEYQVVDLRGKVISKGRLSPEGNEIDFSGFGAGIYILHLEGETLRVVKR